MYRLGQVVKVKGQRGRIILLGDDYVTVQFADRRRVTVGFDQLEDCGCGGAA